MSKFDTLIRHKLEQHTSEFPDDAWDKIASRLDKNKRPTPYFLIGLLTLTCVFSSVIISLSAIHFNITSNKKGQTNNINSETNSTANITEITTISNSKNTSSAWAANNVEQNENNTFVSNHTNSLTTKQASQINTIHNSISSLSQSTLLHTNIGLVLNLPPKFVADQSEESINSINSITTTSITAREQLNIQQLNPKKQNNRLKIKRIFKYTLPKKPINKLKPACPFTSNYKDKSVDIYYSNDYSFKSLTPFNEFEYSKYKDLRVNTESNSYSYAFGARFGYNISYRWNLYTGIQYSAINEKFEYVDPESNQTRVITIKDYVYENGIIVDSVISEEFVNVPGTTKMRINNKYTFIDIPIIGRYTLFANNKFSLSATVGAYVNLKFSKKGKMLSEDGKTVIDFSDDNPNRAEIFNTQASLSLHAGVSLAYHLAPNFDLLIEPHARIQSDKLTLNDYPLSQKFTIAGLSTGLRYKF